jgi:hypothetical protein
MVVGGGGKVVSLLIVTESAVDLVEIRWPAGGHRSGE